MEDLEVVIKFANDEELKVDSETIIFPIRLVDHNEKRFSSTSAPVELAQEFHVHEGFIPALATAFGINEFFYLSNSEESSFKKKIYKTSSIVSFEQRKKLKAYAGRLY